MPSTSELTHFLSEAKLLSNHLKFTSQDRLKTKTQVPNKGGIPVLGSSAQSTSTLYHSSGNRAVSQLRTHLLLMDDNPTSLGKDLIVFDLTL